ncbi:putative transporter [Fagus crenata]
MTSPSPSPSPSPFKCSRTTTTTVKSSSSSICNPSVFFPFHITPPKRLRISTFTFYSSSSKPKQRIQKSSNSDNSTSQPNTFSLNSDSRSQTRPALSFKSLFGRRSLWRRIFFASKKVRSIILLNVIAIIYASNIPVLKEVEAIMDPAAFTVVRFAISAIPFIPFVWQARGDVYTRNAGLELGFWVSLGYLMQALGLLTSDAGRASFISTFTVVLVPLLDGMFGAEVPALTWFGAVISILGVGMLESSGSPPCVGDLLNLLSAVFFGVHMLRTEHISRSTKRENFLALLGYEVCVIALSSIIWYFIGGCFGGMQEFRELSWTWTMLWNWMVTFPWIPALYTGVFSTGLCLWIEMAAMRDVSATETAIIYGLEPVWGAGFAWFLLGERWGAAGWIGAALVLGGSLTVQIFGSSPIKPSEDEEKSESGDALFVSDKQNSLSTSLVSVSRRKDVPGLLKKRHHL